MSLTTPDTATQTFDVSQGASSSYTSLSVASSSPTGTPTATPAAAPSPGTPNWSTYWQQKDPQGWSLVWDAQVAQKQTFTDNLKTGQPVYFSFDVKDSQAEYKNYLTSMTEQQKANARKALQELSNVTGVKFVEKSGVQGGLVLAQADLSSGTDKFSTMGQHQGATLTVRDPKGNVTQQFQQTVMVNKWEYSGQTLAPGTSGFETLLHELGHAAGLDDAKEDLGKKYPNLDDTRYTLMSYEDADGKNRRTYGELDKRAFNILYPVAERPATPPVVAGAGSPTLMSAAANTLDDALYDVDDPTAEAAAEELDAVESIAASPGRPGLNGNQETAASSAESPPRSAAPQDQEAAVTSAEPSPQAASGQDQETVVAVEEGPIDFLMRSTSASATGQNQAAAPPLTPSWMGTADPTRLLAAIPATAGAYASIEAFSHLVSDAEAWKRVLAQG